MCVVSSQNNIFFKIFQLITSLVYDIYFFIQFLSRRWRQSSGTKRTWTLTSTSRNMPSFNGLTISFLGHQYACFLQHYFKYSSVWVYVLYKIRRCMRAPIVTWFLFDRYRFWSVIGESFRDYTGLYFNARIELRQTYLQWSLEISNGFRPRKTSKKDLKGVSWYVCEMSCSHWKYFCFYFKESSNDRE